jgi:hypothetical protein
MRNYSLFVLLIPLISCSLFTNENDGYEVALAKWEESKLVDYEYRYGLGCFCPQVTPAVLVINADTVYQVLDPFERDSVIVQTGENTYEYAGEVYKDFFKTIDELFEVIKDARGADKLKVEYDEENGFPTRIEIDYDKNASDDEVIYTVSNFTPHRILAY